jgi:hypothetical protein
MRYSMLQLLLASRDAGTLLSQIPPRQTRQQYIQRTFGSEITFQHYQATYVYRPFKTPNSDFLVGVVARERPVTIGGPPEEQFIHKEIVSWETANVFIDTSADGEGQKVAMQNVVGQPLAIFKSLVDHINSSNQNADWLIEVNAITSKEQFWSIAEQYRGHIKEVDFDFAVPNIWGATTETEKALREFKEKNNAQSVEVKIKNKDGKLNPDSERVREAVEYAAKGGGVSRIRDDTEATVFSSDREESNITTPLIEPDPPIQEADIDLIRSLIRRIFKVDI